MRSVTVSFLSVLLWASSSSASSKVAVAFGEATYSARYSQALNLEVALTTPDGTPIDGTTACRTAASPDAPCVVAVELRPDDGGDVVLITAPDVAVDAAGRARARLTIVDGRHGDASFASAPEGLPHTLTVRFRGAGTPLPDVTDPECAPGADDVIDGRLCPQTGTSALTIRPEVPALEFAQDVVMGLGETVTVFATLSDETGDADAAGDAPDGSAPKKLGGLPIRFAYDVDGDGRPSAAEFFPDIVLTNDEGVASFDFTADPAFVIAGIAEAGLHAEFAGDARYALARTSTRLTVNASAPDPSRTIIEVTPDSIDANGAAEAVIRVRLVDESGNILGADSPPVDVGISTDLGRLLDTVERNPLDGTYSQTLQSGRAGGVATIRVTVDGEAAGEATVTIVGPEGCTCSSAVGSAPLWVAALLLVFRRRRRR
jgi:MYXO-CTERM domain-containing protein